MSAPLMHALPARYVAPPACECGGSVVFAVTGGTVRVHAADVATLAAFRWHFGPRGYARRTDFVPSARHRARQVYMHNALVSPPDGMFVDHRDRQPTNNCRCNFRLASAGENARNKGGRRGARSPYRGVTPRKAGFQARIAVDGRVLHLGCFRSEVDAAKAYDAAAARLHGEFASLNFPTSRAASDTTSGARVDFDATGAHVRGPRGGRP